MTLPSCLPSGICLPKGEQGEHHIRHPLICFFTAHRISFIARRAGYAEYVCRDCGHLFCFADHSDG